MHPLSIASWQNYWWLHAQQCPSVKSAWDGDLVCLPFSDVCWPTWWRSSSGLHLSRLKLEGEENISYFWPKNVHLGTNLEFSLSHPSMPCIGHPRPCQYHQRLGGIQLNSRTVEFATILNGQHVPISDKWVVPTIELVECHPTPHRQEIMYFWHTLDELLLRTEILPPKQLLLQQSEFGYLFSRGWIIITLGQMGLWRGCGCYLCYLCKMRRHFDTLFA